MCQWWFKLQVSTEAHGKRGAEYLKYTGTGHFPPSIWARGISLCQHRQGALPSVREQSIKQVPRLVSFDKLTLAQAPDSSRDSATHSTQIVLRLYTDCITQTAQTPDRLYHTQSLKQSLQQTLSILNYTHFIDTPLSLSQQYIRVPGSHTCPLFPQMTPLSSTINAT